MSATDQSTPLRLGDSSLSELAPQVTGRARQGAAAYLTHWQASGPLLKQQGRNLAQRPAAPALGLAFLESSG